MAGALRSHPSPSTTIRRRRKAGENAVKPPGLRPKYRGNEARPSPRRLLYRYATRVLPAGSRIGPYEIVALVGAGGMGEVYRAHDTRLGRDVAVKVLSDGLLQDGSSIARFQREARLAGSLDHPNVLAVHDVGEYEGKPYLVAELLDGESLRERLKAGPLFHGKAVALGLQIAE